MPSDEEKVLNLEEFVKQLKSDADDFAKEWKSGMATQPDLFAGEMTLDDWYDQHTAMTMG